MHAFERTHQRDFYTSLECYLRDRKQRKGKFNAHVMTKFPAQFSRHVCTSSFKDLLTDIEVEKILVDNCRTPEMRHLNRYSQHGHTRKRLNQKKTEKEQLLGSSNGLFVCRFKKKCLALTGMKNETRIHLRLNDRNQSSRVNNDVHVEVGFET